MRRNSSDSSWVNPKAVLKAVTKSNIGCLAISIYRFHENIMDYSLTLKMEAISLWFESCCVFNNYLILINTT
jgi:hypothetical protein